MSVSFGGITPGYTPQTRFGADPKEAADPGAGKKSIFARFRRSATDTAELRQSLNATKDKTLNVGKKTWRGIVRTVKKALYRPIRGWGLTLATLATPFTMPIGIAMMVKSFIEGYTGYDSFFIPRVIKISRHWNKTAPNGYMLNPFGGKDKA